MSVCAKFKYAVMAVALLMLAACSQDDATSEMPAPIGELEVLKTLAESYKNVSDHQYSVSPVALPGDERKRFLEKVFADAGYDYSATLHQLAVQGLDKSNKHQKDLAELLLMPHRHQTMRMDVADIYDPQELQDIAAVERALNQ